jgi:hypothetical protein
VGRYTDFSLYWEHWGGYDDRREPFQNPELVRVLASSEVASITRLYQPNSGEITAQARRLDRALVTAVQGLLTEIGVPGEPAALLTDRGHGSYAIVDTLTGVLDGAAYQLELDRTEGAGYTPLGVRLVQALRDLGDVVPVDYRT